MLPYLQCMFCMTEQTRTNSFQIRATVDQSHTLSKIRTEDHLELRNMLQKVMEDVTELRLAVKDNRDDVPALMESVQKVDISSMIIDWYSTSEQELTSSDLETRQEQTFRRMLWELREETNELPPLSDRELTQFCALCRLYIRLPVTGQIGDISPHAVVLGGSSDIHTGISVPQNFQTFLTTTQKACGWTRKRSVD